MKCPERMKEFTNLSPSSAKALGRRVPLRSDWEEVKDFIMEAVCYAKFTQNEGLKEKLIATGDAKLVEGNTWNDIYWGMCKGKGQNKLGEILMKLREEFQYNDTKQSNNQYVPNVGDICIYYITSDYDVKTLVGLSVVQVESVYDNNMSKVKFLQVFEDLSGNNLFKYLEDKNESMMVTTLFLHPINIANEQKAVINNTDNKEDIPVYKIPTPPDEEFPIEFKLVVSNSGNRSISVCVNNDEVITVAEDITEALERFEERMDEIDVY